MSRGGTPARSSPAMSRARFAGRSDSATKSERVVTGSPPLAGAGLKKSKGRTSASVQEPDLNLNYTPRSDARRSACEDRSTSFRGRERSTWQKPRTFHGELVAHGLLNQPRPQVNVLPPLDAVDIVGRIP